MRNWSTDEKSLRSDPDKYAIWRLEQTVNFGLNGGKISEAELRIYLQKLSLDPARRAFLELLLYDN